MTRQRTDDFNYNGKLYELAAFSDFIGFFKPEEYGFKPKMATTNCGRGYWCEYAIEDEMLLLKCLHIHTADGVYPDFNGAPPVMPQPIDMDYQGIQKTTMDNLMHLAVYETDMRVPYSGRILLGRDFMYDRYKYMGFLTTWGHRELLEMVFEDGFLKEVNDQSEDAAKARELKDRCWWLKY